MIKTYKVLKSIDGEQVWLHHLHHHHSTPPHTHKFVLSAMGLAREKEKSQRNLNTKNKEQNTYNGHDNAYGLISW